MSIEAEHGYVREDPEMDPSEDLTVRASRSAIEEARARYFGSYDERFQVEAPESWPYFEVVVNTKLEGDLVRAIAPQRAHVDIVTIDEAARRRRWTR